MAALLLHEVDDTRSGPVPSGARPPAGLPLTRRERQTRRWYARRRGAALARGVARRGRWQGVATRRW